MFKSWYLGIGTDHYRGSNIYIGIYSEILKKCSSHKPVSQRKYYFIMWKHPRLYRFKFVKIMIFGGARIGSDEGRFISLKNVD